MEDQKIPDGYKLLHDPYADHLPPSVDGNIMITSKGFRELLPSNKQEYPILSEDLLKNVLGDIFRGEADYGKELTVPIHKAFFLVGDGFFMSLCYYIYVNSPDNLQQVITDFHSKLVGIEHERLPRIVHLMKVHCEMLESPESDEELNIANSYFPEDEHREGSTLTNLEICKGTISVLEEFITS